MLGHMVCYVFSYIKKLLDRLVQMVSVADSFTEAQLCQVFQYLGLWVFPYQQCW